LNLLSFTKKSFQKENMFEPFDVICHVTVAFYIYHFIGALTLYVCDTSLEAHLFQLQYLCTQQSIKISKKLKKNLKVG
jgi:hypothetical protein